LLVVTAVIAILAVMLLPTQASARYRAKVINCTSNHGQWGIAVSVCANDVLCMGTCMPMQYFDSC
jgi:hypothetical protein